MTSQYQISGRRPAREIEHALHVTTGNMHGLMQEAREKRDLMNRARSESSKQTHCLAMQWAIRTARDKSRHALTLRRMLREYGEL